MVEIMKDYTINMKWAVISMCDRSTQDDNRSKIEVVGLFQNPIVAEDCFIPNLPNEKVKRYLLPINKLESFENFYNFIQKLNEKYEGYAIFHIKDGNFTCDEENFFRNILGIWTDTKIQ